MKRKDDFIMRREHIKDLTDEQLENKFWKLTELIVKPMVDIAYNNTSPSIERSVLLRMGFSSIEASKITKYGIKWNLLEKGMGHVVLEYADIINKDYIEAGRKLSEGKGWAEISQKMGGRLVEEQY